MKIVVLDGYTENPGDLSWEGLEALGELTVCDRTPKDKIIERMQGAQVVYTNKTPIDAQTICACPNLQFIGLLSTGYNVVDGDAATECGITVANIPGYSTDAVAQLVFGLLLEVCHHVGHHSDVVKAGKWSANPDFTFWDYPLIELKGKAMGIFGFGSIGARVAEVAKAFGMEVLAHTRTPKEGIAGVEFVSWDELLRRADVLSLHAPLTEQTKDIINKDSIAKMKHSAILINTARGPLVNEADLAEALAAGGIYAAGLDVLGQEPPDAGNPLFGLANVIITPHIAWAAKETRERLMDIAVENLKMFLNGTPQNVVNGK
ncbi:D-2-hydroxyacid dehydrogenase [Christensenellaceae bacterium OttesenSCG-928-K19]|nr:D-2-hydroxyacid dehydrogenase [Christensenellaceae bacterium OttesenSCG-928-K19]